MAEYKILAHKQTCEKCVSYIEDLQSGAPPGRYLREQIKEVDLSLISVEAFIELLFNTKRPQIFAESAVYGDGSDWNQRELSILGDTSVVALVVVYDNGAHAHPMVHDPPFETTLVFTPGALLNNGRGQVPADWDEVTVDGDIDPERYTWLYERRLVPVFLYINQAAKSAGKTALVTIPGLGCGQFAGTFRGRLGDELKDALAAILDAHGKRLPHIRAVYYDPYRECENERTEIDGISYMVRPLAKGNENKPQLCRPTAYEEAGDDFGDCALFSIVAWDHVSWPGNDFYTGGRVTDDGVKAAATNVMAVMTGVEGSYDAQINAYRPPAGYRNWEAMVLERGLRIDVEGRVGFYA